ncbi:RNA chaperone Hfq [Anaerobiospirillum thomasii]|uniref:Host factor-I protein n=1 Tax=Anaerobiospirillum thomasii TaxID=179995 RepID=A0A2X0WWR8_9GAMM|nr:RNA chaperone Hfq [Anaerobiospirillum thomasii]SPT69961.1 Host factor-I protein [Anaerobiospirillum thomasii]
MNHTKNNNNWASSHAGNFKSLSSAFALNGGQDGALRYLTDNNISICVFLVTGMKFEGVLQSFDQYTICIMDIKGRQQLIYKDKISTLMVNNKVN